MLRAGEYLLAKQTGPFPPTIITPHDRRRTLAAFTTLGPLVAPVFCSWPKSHIEGVSYTQSLRNLITSSRNEIGHVHGHLIDLGRVVHCSSLANAHKAKPRQTYTQCLAECARPRL